MSDLYESLFGTSTPIEWWQQLDRTVVVFVYGIALVRLAGKRAFGRFGPLDIVVSVIAGSNLSRALTGNAPLLATLASTTLLVLLYRAGAHAAARWPKLSRILEGHAAELGRDGKADQAALVRHAISACALDEALRQKSVERVEETRRITLEPGGQISVFKKEG